MSRWSKWNPIAVCWPARWNGRSSSASAEEGTHTSACSMRTIARRVMLAPRASDAGCAAEAELASFLTYAREGRMQEAER